MIFAQQSQAYLTYRFDNRGVVYDRRVTSFYSDVRFGSVCRGNVHGELADGAE